LGFVALSESEGLEARGVNRVSQSLHSHLAALDFQVVLEELQ